MNCFHTYAATFAKGPLEPFSFNPGRSTFMANSSRPNVIRLLAFTVSALVLAATSRRSSSHRLPNRWPRPAASIPLGNRGNPLHLERRICWEREAFRWRAWHYQNYSHVGMGPEDRHGLPRGERQGRQTVEGDLSGSQLSSQSDAMAYCLMPAWTTQTRTIGFSAETRYPGTGKSPSHECLQNAARITF